MSATIERQSASPNRRAKAAAPRESGRRRPAPSRRSRLTGLLSPRTAATVALAPAGITLLVVTLVIVLTLVGSGSDLTGLSGAIGAAWLVVHLAPVEISGAPLTAAPALPAILVVWSVARLCRRVARGADGRRTLGGSPDGRGTADSRGRTDSRSSTDSRSGDGSAARLGAIIGAAVVGPVLVAAAAYGLVVQASAVVAIAPGPFLPSMVAVALVYIVGAVIGVWPVLWPATVDWFALPGWSAVAGRAARQGGLVLVVGAAVLIGVLLSLSVREIGEMFSAPIGLFGVIGVVILSVLYAPTVLVGTVAVLVGSSIRVGDVDVSLFAASGGTQPIPLPIMAVLPEATAAGWWPLLVVLTAASGIRVGIICAHNLPDRVVAIKAVALAAVCAGSIAGALGWLVGGAAGSRVDVQINVIGLAGGLAGWWLIAGAVTVALLFHLGDDFLGAPDPLTVAQRAGRELDGPKRGSAEAAPTAKKSSEPSTSEESADTPKPAGTVEAEKPEADNPEDTKSEDAKPVDPQPEPDEPKDAKPKDAKPKNAKPEAEKPEADKRGNTKPVDTTPEDAKPVGAEPEAEKPVDSKTVDSKTVDTTTDAPTGSSDADTSTTSD